MVGFLHVMGARLYEWLDPVRRNCAPFVSVLVICSSNYLSIYVPMYLPTYRPTCLSTYLPMYLSPISLSAHMRT